MKERKLVLLDAGLFIGALLKGGDNFAWHLNHIII